LPESRVIRHKQSRAISFPPESSEPIVIDVYPYIPNITGLGVEILAEELGLEEITSGVWKFELSVWSSPGLEGEIHISETCYILLDGVVSCCIEKKN